MKNAVLFFAIMFFLILGVNAKTKSFSDRIIVVCMLILIMTMNRSLFL